MAVIADFTLLLAVTLPTAVIDSVFMVDGDGVACVMHVRRWKS